MPCWARWPCQKRLLSAKTSQHAAVNASMGVNRLNMGALRSDLRNRCRSAPRSLGALKLTDPLPHTVNRRPRFGNYKLGAHFHLGGASRPTIDLEND